MSDYSIDVVDSDHCVAHWRNVFIQIWRSNPTEARTRGMREHGKRFIDSAPSSVGAVVVVEHKCQLPDQAARAHSTAFLSDLRERGKGIVLVFEGEGFLAAASRATMVGLMTAAQYPTAYKIVRTTSEADDFLRPMLRTWSSPGDLMRAVEEVRTTIGTSASVSDLPDSGPPEARRRSPR